MIRPATIDRGTTERVVFGLPAAQAVAEQAAMIDARRVFVLATGTLARATDEVDTIVAALGDRYAATFTGVGARTPMVDVIEATRAARIARTDLIVTVGGGSVTDAGKIIALGLKAGIEGMDDVAPLLDRYRWSSPRSDAASAPDVPLICVPTTLSGGELNSAGAANDPVLGKLAFGHVAGAPLAIVYDPWIVRHTPDDLWLYTGIRSVDHAVETIASLRSNIYCDAIATTALRLLADGLASCRRDFGDIEARLKCQIGAWQSMVAIRTGVPMGASHALSHGLSGIAGVAHGLNSCVVLSAVQQWNASAVPERLAMVSAALGDPAVPAHILIERLISSLGLPYRLAHIGIGDDPDRMAAIADYALTIPWARTNPRPVEGRAELLEILALAR